jgi:hypothetical protein
LSESALTEPLHALAPLGSPRQSGSRCLLARDPRGPHGPPPAPSRSAEGIPCSRSRSQREAGRDPAPAGRSVPRARSQHAKRNRHGRGRPGQTQRAQPRPASVSAQGAHDIFGYARPARGGAADERIGWALVEDAERAAGSSQPRCSVTTAVVSRLAPGETRAREPIMQSPKFAAAGNHASHARRSRTRRAGTPAAS